MLKTIFFMIFILVSMDALACSCAGQPDDLNVAVKKAYASASSVVLAEVEAITPSKTLEKIGEKQYELKSEITHFSEIRSWKGEHGKRFYTKIVTACCMCGISFKKGEKYLLYLHGPHKEGFYSTSHCTRTTNKKRAEDDIQILNKISPYKSIQGTLRTPDAGR